GLRMVSWSKLVQSSRNVSSPSVPSMTDGLGWSGGTKLDEEAVPRSFRVDPTPAIVSSPRPCVGIMFAIHHPMKFAPGGPAFISFLSGIPDLRNLRALAAAARAVRTRRYTPLRRRIDSTSENLTS